MADISGSWLGTYWQEGVPTRFEVTLVQAGNAITGRILDDSYLGEAQLTGEVIGRSIRFVKHYLTTSPNPISYTGTISEDANAMQGKWAIGRFSSGGWEAHRGNNDLMAELNDRLAKQLPTHAGLADAGPVLR